MKRLAFLPFVAGVATAMAAGWIATPRLLYRQEAQPIQFSHRAHGSAGAGMTCADCHPLLEDGRFGRIPPLARCAECHQEMMGTSPAERILVEEYVRPGREIPWLVYARQPDNVFFSHAWHVRQAGLSCERCHGEHGASATLPAFEVGRLSGYSRDVGGPSRIARATTAGGGKRMSDCARCHRQCDKDQSCLDCHK